MAEGFAEHGAMSRFEEPVSSDDLDGLRLIRDQHRRAWTSPPASTATTCPTSAGCSPPARSTACRPTSPAAAASPPSSVSARCDATVARTVVAHRAQVSVHAGACVWHMRHLEYFADHVRIESMLFDGVLEPVAGALHPDPDPPGLGIELKHADADRYRR